MTSVTQGEQGIFQRLMTLSADLNMDGTATDEAWLSFQRISNSYTLEGDALHWLACALYVACRTGAVPTVGKGNYIEGNCVSLTRLLRSCKLSLVQFFTKMKKWADMANLPKDMRDKVDRLERSFNVSTVIFKKFEPIFVDVFKDTYKEPPKPTRNRKQRRQPCAPSEVFSFCWTLFIRVKGNFPAISEDLVNSYHLLLCCVDLLYANALLAERQDLLNPNFSGLPENYNTREYKTPTSPPCIVELLCKKHQGIAVEAKGIKEHWWKPYIRRLMEKKILKGKPETLTSLLDTQYFETNCKAINKEYEEHVLNVGDFDERIFLGDNASEEIGTPAKHPYLSSAEFAEKMQRNLQQHMQETKSLFPSTPLTGRKYLRDKEAAYITPVSTATQSVSRLQSLLMGRTANPSEALLEIFRECNSDPHEKIVSRVKEMGETFCTRYSMPSEDHPGSHIEFAKKRLQLAENLYYKALEDIMLLEKKKCPSKTDFSVMLEHDVFHRSLFACCLEIVIFSYNSQRSFPWVLQIFGLHPYHFYKVIELLIRAEDGLSRDVVKHLNHIEEQILESLAWKSESPLWNAIAALNTNVPSCEEVSLPSQHKPVNNTASQIISSPLAHPALRRVTGERSIRKAVQSDNGIAYFLPTQITRSSDDSGNQPAVVPAHPVQPSEKAAEGTTSPKPVLIESKPKRGGSLGLFFRKVYYLAGVRLKELCDRLSVSDSELRQKIWTCFENSLMQHTDLMCDRHLDQLLMCAVYVMCKVTKEDRSFQEIMKCYRLQPQAASHIYRSVLLSTKKRRNSGSSDNSKNGSGSNSPVLSEKEEREAKRSERLNAIRSTSTLPVPHPGSQPPTPTRLAGTGTQFEFEERGDLIMFYNMVFVPKLQKFAYKFSVTNNGLESPPLSPLPRLNANPQSPWRRVSTKHSLYISPLTNANFPPSPNRPLSYSFSRSPAKDLRAINNLVKLGEKKVGKRNLQDDLELENSAKRLCQDPTLRKIQNVITDRQGTGNGVSD